MKKLRRLLTLTACSLLLLPVAQGAKLALVIDDFGYREQNEKRIIEQPYPITVAVLPNAPNAVGIATLAHQSGKEVIIHLPMAPMGKQHLEVDTITPSMSEREINAIIDKSVKAVPYAIGVNNHMGSLMTSDLEAMQRVMRVISTYPLFFLDSRTISTTVAILAAKQFRIATASRDVFLDDIQQESAIAKQFDLAVQIARRKGSAIAIGHPYHATVKVLQTKLAQLPDDIELVFVSSLISTPPTIKLCDMFAYYKMAIEQTILDAMIMFQSTRSDG